MKLYIIGNGFDRAHKLPTEYRDFAKYLAESQKEEYQWIGLLYNHCDESWLWKDYETNLSNIDIIDVGAFGGESNPLRKTDGGRDCEIFSGKTAEHKKRILRWYYEKQDE